MKLKSFKIETYRSCKRTLFPINDDLTTLIGPNGSGKSNIMNAMYLFHQLINAKLIPLDQKQRYNTSNFQLVFSIENKTFNFNGKLYYETKQNQDTIHHCFFRWNFKNFIDFPQWFEIPFIYLKDKKIFTKEYNAKKEKFVETEFDTKLLGNIDDNAKEVILYLIGETYNFFNNMFFFEANMFSDPKICPDNLQYGADILLTEIFEHSYHLNFMDSLIKGYKQKSEEFNRFINLVNKNGIGLIDSFEKMVIELPLSLNDLNKRGKDKNFIEIIFPQFSINDQNLNMNQLSKGVFRALALIYYLLNSNCSLMLIEEPEFCIHHELLSKIIDMIKEHSKEKQIIFSTHSNFVIGKLKQENLLILKNTKKDGTTAKPLEKLLSKRDLKEFNEFLVEVGNLGDYWEEFCIDYYFDFDDLKYDDEDDNINNLVMFFTNPKG